MKRLVILFVLIIFNLCACSSESRTVDNGLIADFADKGWEYTEVSSSMGESDSFFEDYDIYFDDGISIKYAEIAETDENGWKGYNFSRTGCVENIVFNGRYSGTFFGDIKIGAAKADIIKTMGSPDFEDAEKNVFGYKADDIYIFCIGENTVDEISVYPIYKNYDTAVVDEVIALCSDGEYSRGLACRAAELLEQNWTDYNYSYNIPDRARYSDRSRGVGIAYYDRGVQLSYRDNEATAPMLTIYGNYSGKVSEAVNNSAMIEYAKDTDLVFEQEKRRLKQAGELNAMIKTDGEVSPDGSIVLVDNSTSTGIDVIHPNKDKPDYCIMTSPLQADAAKWINDRYIVYIFGKSAARVYDMENNKYKNIDGVYMETEIMTDAIRLVNSIGEVTDVSYYFGENGEIVLNNGNQMENVSDNWVDGTLASITNCSK